MTASADRYEKSFTELWQQLGQEVFQSSLGEEQYDKNYKKKPSWPDQNQLGHRDAGEIVVDRKHSLAQCPNGFRLSSYLQEIIAYLGSDYVFKATVARRLATC